MKKEVVLLDTSFIIRLLNKEDELHNNVLDYFRYFLEHDYELKISTIAIAEYCVKGNIEDLPLRNMQVLPFNYDHAVCAGDFCAAAFSKRKEDGIIITPRTVIPNDTKMFAQAQVEKDISIFASTDVEAKKVYDMISSKHEMGFEFMNVRESYNSTFSKLF